MQKPLKCARCVEILDDDGGDEISGALCYECVTMDDVNRLFRALDALDAWNACSDNGPAN
jgi:hypothetical protein